MLRVVILNTTYQSKTDGESYALAYQQLRGLRFEITKHLISQNRSFKEIAVDADHDQDIMDFVAQKSFIGHTICIASGEIGLQGLMMIARALNKDPAEREKWLITWVGSHPSKRLQSICCTIDLVILPHWKMALTNEILQERAEQPFTFQVIWNYGGYFSDWQRHYACFEPNETIIPKNISETTSIIGLIIGGNIPSDVMRHWVHQICVHNKNINDQVHVVLMDSMLSNDLPDRGISLIKIIIDILKEHKITHTFVEHTNTLPTLDKKSEPLRQIPMYINWIESRSGRFYVTGDNLGDIYNILASTPSFQIPTVCMLMPQSPETSTFIDQSFFKYHSDQWFKFMYKETPWLTITPGHFDDELSNAIDQHICSVSIMQDEIPTHPKSCFKKLCETFSIFKTNRSYSKVRKDPLSTTEHGETHNPIFTIT